MKSFLNLFAITALLIGATAGAQEVAPPKSGTLSVIKEVFMKGSIDGKQMFMVLGMQDGFEVTKDIAEGIVTERELDWYSHRAEKLADHIYDDKKDNYAAATRKGVEAAEDLAPRILERPWRSLKEIPKSFKVNLDKGQDAYYNSKNGVAGAVKYSGWAAWAVIEGSYYLILEAPVRFAFNLAGTVLAVPTAWAVQTIRVGFDVACLAFLAVWNGLKAAILVPTMLAVEIYSVLSSTVATTLTLVAAGGLAIIKAGKFLFVDGPRRIRYPVGVKAETGIEFNEKEQINMANQVVTHYSAKDNELNITRVESNIRKYKSSIDLYATKDDGSEIHYGVIAITVSEKMVRARLDVSRKMFKIMKRNGMTRDAVKAMVTESLKDAVKIPVVTSVAVGE